MLQERGEITLQQNHFQIFLLVAGQLYNRLCQILLDIFLRYGTSVSIFFFIGGIVCYEIHAGFYTFLIISRSIFRNPATHSSFCQNKILFCITQPHQRLTFRNTGIAEVCQAELTFSVQHGDI